MTHPPTLLQHLLLTYDAWLAANAGSDLNSEQITTHLKHLQSFGKWAQIYLDEHRPVNVQHGYESNFLLQLAGDQGMIDVLVAPPAEAKKPPGAGQAIAINTSRGGPQGVVNTEVVPISGPAAPPPQRGPDLTQERPAVDYTQPQPQMDLTQPGNTWPGLGF